jgi:hypothetical protein
MHRIGEQEQAQGEQEPEAEAEAESEEAQQQQQQQQQCGLTTWHPVVTRPTAATPRHPHSRRSK